MLEKFLCGNNNKTVTVSKHLLTVFLNEPPAKMFPMQKKRLRIPETFFDAL